MQIGKLPDGSNFDLVYLHQDKLSIRETPHCKLHGAMNKVSKTGLWRCIRAEMGKEGITKEQMQELRKGRDCRAGCEETD